MTKNHFQPTKQTIMLLRRQVGKLDLQRRRQVESFVHIHNDQFSKGSSRKRTRGLHSVTSKCGITFTDCTPSTTTTSSNNVGSVRVTKGKNVVRATASISGKKNQETEQSFLPFHVIYQEMGYANCNIPRTLTRRELGEKAADVLNGRAIDRAIRPCIKDFMQETQVVARVESYDGTENPAMLALNACSAALMIGGVPNFRSSCRFINFESKRIW